jgi:hypothetical protein
VRPRTRQANQSDGIKSVLRIALTIGGLIVAVVLVAACAPTRTLNALTPTDTYRADDNVAYGSDPGNGWTCISRAPPTR